MKHDLIMVLLVSRGLAGFCVRAVLEAWFAALLGSVVALATCSAVIAWRRSSGRLPEPATRGSCRAPLPE